jgi:hypothetical protein
VIASAAVTTGLFVLAGVVVGGLVTGTVNYGFESRRERARVAVAVRLLEAELILAAAQADLRLQDGEWSPWNFESAHRTWREYRPDVARLPPDEWFAVSVAYFAIEQIEQRFSNEPAGVKLGAEEQRALDGQSGIILEGANTLRRRQGQEEMARMFSPETDPGDD